MWDLRRWEQPPQYAERWRGHMASALPQYFNADVALPRLLFLVSPTCEICVAGAMSVAHTVLSLPRADAFRLYILWLPVLEQILSRRRNVCEGVCPETTGWDTLRITTWEGTMYAHRP
jgi:hypothetical protein